MKIQKLTKEYEKQRSCLLKINPLKNFCLVKALTVEFLQGIFPTRSDLYKVKLLLTVEDYFSKKMLKSACYMTLAQLLKSPYIAEKFNTKKRRFIFLFQQSLHLNLKVSNTKQNFMCIYVSQRNMTC